MSKNKRKENRFSDIGKVTCSNLCVFPGVLIDVSLKGCRIRFPALLNPDQDQDQDQEYELSISLFGKTTSHPLLLIAHLQWVRLEKNTTELGLNFIRSPGTKALSEYIERISAKEQGEDSSFFVESRYV